LNIVPRPKHETSTPVLPNFRLGTRGTLGFRVFSVALSLAAAKPVASGTKAGAKLAVPIAFRKFLLPILSRFPFITLNSKKDQHLNSTNQANFLTASATSSPIGRCCGQ
jgi:hypothetical protein